jgi:hypothetical protein
MMPVSWTGDELTCRKQQHLLLELKFLPHLPYKHAKLGRAPDHCLLLRMHVTCTRERPLESNEIAKAVTHMFTYNCAKAANRSSTIHAWRGMDYVLSLFARDKVHNLKIRCC